MFDTVNFWIDYSKYDEEVIKERLSKNLIKVDEIFYPKSDRYSFYGHIKNYRFNMNHRGISLQGSIAKLIHGSATVKFADRIEYKRGVEELSDLLGYELNNASVTRVDIGQNLELNNLVLEYYPLLIAASRLNREVIKNSLYFQNDSKELIFYDKNLEHTEKGYGKLFLNLLRYELRFMKNPSCFLKTEKILAKDLYEESIYKQLGDIWYNNYKKIEKTPIRESLININNPTELKNSLARVGLLLKVTQVLKQIKIKLKKGLITKTNADRCKRLIIDLQKGGSVEPEENDLLIELNSKMEFAYNQLLKSI